MRRRVDHMTTIRVLIADDHALVRTGFRLLLEGASEIKVIGEAESGEQAYTMYGNLLPDVLMIDIAMPGIGGIEAIKKVIARHHEAKVLALSAHEDLSHPRRVLQAGAMGYLSKRQAPEVLIDAIRSVAQGRMVIDPEVAQRMAMADVSGEGNPLAGLSEREFEVFKKLALGQSVAQIAKTLNLSPSTVGTHLYNVKQKLGMSNQAEMTLLAVRNKVIEP